MRTAPPSKKSPKIEEQPDRNYWREPPFMVFMSDVFHHPRIDKKDLHLLFIISNLESNHLGWCFAGNEYLADALRVGQRRMQTIIRKLIDLGFVERVLVKKEKGRGTIRYLRTTLNGNPLPAPSKYAERLVPGPRDPQRHVNSGPRPGGRHVNKSPSLYNNKKEKDLFHHASGDDGSEDDFQNNKSKKTPKKKPANKPAKKFRPNQMRLSKKVRKFHLQSLKKKRRPTNQEIVAGADVLDKLERIDGYNWADDIVPAIEWALFDDFWSTQMQSCTQLRKKKNGADDDTKFEKILIRYRKENEDEDKDLECPFDDWTMEQVNKYITPDKRDLSKLYYGLKSIWDWHVKANNGMASNPLWDRYEPTPVAVLIEYFKFLERENYIQEINVGLINTNSKMWPRFEKWLAENVHAPIIRLSEEKRFEEDIHFIKRRDTHPYRADCFR